MSNELIWQQNSSESNNSENLSAIAQWWSNLANQEIAWQQRLIPPSGNLQDIDWQPQKFDEKFILSNPQLKGITIFWRNNQATAERNITASKLQLNLTKQQLYIFPQSQSQVVISIKLPETIYQKLNLNNPQIAATFKNGNGIILLRGESEKLEIKLTLDEDKLNQLRERLKNNDNQ